jgi:hypothetical protein
MARTTDEVLFIHTTAQVNDLLRAAPERERHSVDSMVEAPTLTRCQAKRR